MWFLNYFSTKLQSSYYHQLNLKHQFLGSEFGSPCCWNSIEFGLKHQIGWNRNIKPKIKYCVRWNISLIFKVSKISPVFKVFKVDQITISLFRSFWYTSRFSGFFWVSSKSSFVLGLVIREMQECYKCFSVSHSVELAFGPLFKYKPTMFLALVIVQLSYSCPDRICQTDCITQLTWD